MYHRHRNPFSTEGTGRGPGGSGSYPSSLTFSNPCWFGDFATIGLQVYTSSTVTLYAWDRNSWVTSSTTANDGSVVTVISAPGVYKIEPGFEWGVFQRSSSTNTIFYTGQSRN